MTNNNNMLYKYKTKYPIELHPTFANLRLSKPCCNHSKLFTHQKQFSHTLRSLQSIFSYITNIIYTTSYAFIIYYYTYTCIYNSPSSCIEYSVSYSFYTIPWVLMMIKA